MSFVLAFVIISACLAVTGVPLVAGASVVTDGVCTRSIRVTRVSLVRTLVRIRAYDTITFVARFALAFAACATAGALAHTLGDAAAPDSGVAFVIFRARTREEAVGVCTQRSFARQIDSVRQARGFPGNVLKREM